MKMDSRFVHYFLLMVPTTLWILTNIPPSQISIPPSEAVRITKLIADTSPVQLIGLGARDSLRLEAGMCLYGHDLDETVSPIEAGLAWLVGEQRLFTFCF